MDPLSPLQDLLPGAAPPDLPAPVRAAQPTPPPLPRPMPPSRPPPARLPARPRPVPAAAATRSQVRAPLQDGVLGNTPARPAPEQAPAAPPARSRSGDQDAALEARIREAVQAAVHYPAAARMMGITGRARVLLDYRSGAVSSPALMQSSGTPMLDDAALAAARTARYPAAPPEVGGQLLQLLVWVEFRPA